MGAKPDRGATGNGSSLEAGDPPPKPGDGRAESELSENERWKLPIEGSAEDAFKQFFEQPMGLHIIAREDGRILRVNLGWELALGFSRGQLEGTNFLELIHPDDLAPTRAEMDKLSSGQTTFHFENRYRHRNGGYRIIEWSASFSMRERQIYALGIDITERRQASRALQESEDRYRLLFESNPLPMWVYDRQTLRFLAVNQAAVEHYGYSEAEFLRMTLLDIRPPEDSERLRHNLARVTQGIDRAGQWRHRLKDGRLIDVEITSHVLEFLGRPAELVLVNDVTTRRQAEREKALIEEQLRQSQRLEALGTLAGGIAHDLNNILAGITGFNALARQSIGQAVEQADCFDEIDQAGHRAVQLVQQILAFARGSGHTFVPVDLGQVVSEAVGLLRATLPTTIEFDVRSPPGLPAVQGNATQMHQVIMNLGANAGHAMREQGGILHIRLEACEADDQVANALPDLPRGRYVRLTVADTGHGMDAATKARAFEPFFTTKGPGEGNGLGLAVVHGIVRGHHGALRLSSEVGRGTTVEIHLPALATPAAGTEDKEKRLPRGNGERILFVDDEPMLLSLGERRLSLLGYRAESEGQVTKALQRIEQDPQAFDLVVTDQTMPVMTGLDFAARIREIRPDLPVILTSGYSLGLTPERIRAAGVREVLSKPYTQESLAAAVRRQLSKEAPSS